MENTVLLEMSGTELVSVTEICRVCANRNEKLLEIYGGDGEENDLATKINTYLPVKVDKSDSLPLQCCLHCTSTILAWHELYLNSIEADRRLQNSQIITEKQLENNSDTNFAQIEDENDDSKMKLEHNESVLTDINDYSEYISLPQEYLPLEAIYEKSETDDLSQEAENTVDDPPIKDEVCFGCQMCQMVFFNEEKMHQHIAEKHNNTVKKPQKKNSKINQDMVNAAKIVVDGKVYYNCKECNRCLYSPYTYVWHMRIHTGERPHTCHQCGKCFRVSQGLVRHLKETHQGIKTFPCDLCGRMFGTRRNAEEHRRIHTNERPYICDLCGKSFKQKASLYVHNRSHLDVFPFKCTYCDQAFRTKPSMLVHLTKHTGEKPHACDVCGRRFRIKYELKRHRLIHSDEKPWACDVCGLRFKQKRYLKNHNKLNHTL